MEGVTDEAVRRGLESMARGEGRPAEQVLEELRKKHKIPRRT
jgi:predicted transcriptional regulator